MEPHIPYLKLWNWILIVDNDEHLRHKNRPHFRLFNLTYALTLMGFNQSRMKSVRVINDWTLNQNESLLRLLKLRLGRINFVTFQFKCIDWSRHKTITFRKRWTGKTTNALLYLYEKCWFIAKLHASKIEPVTSYAFIWKNMKNHFFGNHLPRSCYFLASFLPKQHC